MGRSHPAQWTIMSPACRTPSADLPARTALLGMGQPGSTRNNVLAPGEALSGENWRYLPFKGSRVTVPWNSCSPAPVCLLSWHLSQSKIQRRKGEISAALAERLRNERTRHFSHEHTVKTSLFTRVLSDILSLAHALFWVQSFPSGSLHVATFSITVPGLSRGFASARRVLRSDWMTPLLIPVTDEPIRAQLLWLQVHSYSLRANPDHTPHRKYQGRGCWVVSGAFRGQFAFGRFNGGSWKKKTFYGKIYIYTADG